MTHPLEAIAWVPVFPLPNLVLFPNALLPLHIFEPRYRAMIRECFPKPGKIAITRLLEPEAASGVLPEIDRICTVGEILECDELPDGRKNILVRGEARVRLSELEFVAPYRRARLTVLADEGKIAEHVRSALVASAASFAQAIQKVDPRFGLRIPDDISADALVDICAYQLIVDPNVRQELLEEVSLPARADRLIGEIARQHSALRESGRGRTLH